HEAAGVEGDALRAEAAAPVAVDDAATRGGDALEVVAGEERVGEVHRLDVGPAGEGEPLGRSEVVVVRAREEDGAGGQLERHAAAERERAAPPGAGGKLHEAAAQAMGRVDRLLDRPRVRGSAVADAAEVPHVERRAARYALAPAVGRLARPRHGVDAGGDGQAPAAEEDRRAHEVASRQRVELVLV